MKSLQFIFLLLFFLNSCKKDDQKTEPPSDYVTGTFHVSGKFLLDCSNAPMSNKLIGLGSWKFVCLFCNLEYKSFAICVTDNQGNFYFEYTVTNFYPKNNPLQISLDWQGGIGISLDSIPSGVNVENIIIHEAPSTVVELNLNFIDTLDIDSVKIVGGFGGINLTPPFQNGYLTTYIDTDFIGNNYNEPRRFGIYYSIYGNINESKYVIFDASICDTTIAVLNIKK